MLSEEDIKQKLNGKFPFLQDKVSVKRARRLSLDVAMENFKEVLLFSIKDLAFSHLCTITGLDMTDRFSMIYQLSQDEGIMLNIRTDISRSDPNLDSITPIFSNADIYERELADLFGINVKGLPAGERYPLPDDWPSDQYPLRKDFNIGSLDKKETV